MERKKRGRKPEPSLKRGVAWPRWTGLRGMTLRDWLDLLFVPVFIALGAAALGGLQACAQIQAEEQRAQQAAVRAYLDQMGKMLLKEGKSLLDSKEGDPVQTLAQSRTLAVLDALGSDLGPGPNNKRIIMRFLYENSLIDRDNPIIRLNEADLEEADLNYMNLSNAYLPFVFLARTNLDHANLEDAELAGAHLENAYLGGANLTNAHLKYTYLNDADLGGADLDSTYLEYADLRGAHLEDANLSGAYLDTANLSDASLLGGMGGAFLMDGTGVTDNLQVQRTRALGLVTTPGGKVHAGRYVTEEFLKSEDSGAILSFEVGEDWERKVDEASSGELYLKNPKAPGTGELIFTSPLHAFHAFEQGNSSEPKEAPAPQNADAWASWFQEHPNLEHSKLVSVSVGSATGIMIDVMTPASGLEDYPGDFCGGRPCVPLYKGPDDESALAVFKDWTDRLAILDVEGETVIIDISAKTKELKTFHQKAQQVLGTVKWNYSSSPSPDDVLESQYRHINAGHYRLAYDLFADQSQEIISKKQYKAYFASEAPYVITSYSFSPVRTPGDTACVEVDLAVSSASGESEFQDTQQLVREDGSWRVVMRDAQVESFANAGSPSAGASADGSPEDGMSCESLP